MIQQPLAGSRSERGPARGVAGWPGRYLAWARRHPQLVDSTLVAVLLLLAVPNLLASLGQHPLVTWALVLGLLLPLAWRRRAPFLVFLIVAVAALGDWAARQPMAADLAPLIAFYTVAANQSGRRILAAAGMLELGALLAALWFWSRGAAAVIFIFLSITGMTAAAGFVGFNIRTRRAYLAALEDRAARLEAERDRETQLAAAAERARIAREMHDIVAHHIAVMIALADGAAYTSEASPERAAGVMRQVSGTGRAALTEMRRLLGVMRQPAAGSPAAGSPAAAGPDTVAGAGGATGATVIGPDGGLAAQAPQATLDDLEDLLATVRAAGLPTRLTVSGERPALPPTAQLAVYRMIQEALTNTLKHARATAAQVQLSYRPGEVELEVTDNGTAARPAAGRAAGPAVAGGHLVAGLVLPGSALPGSGPASGADDAAGLGGAAGYGGAGHGIAGMRERAAVFGGQVSAGPELGGGWRVHTVLQVDPELHSLPETAVTGRTEGS
ncbi:MAG TPA: histidine kinase [Streptosporangiaceae bacterium]|nr:histidine kinase [Streptosporangiaceae bacterium]